MKVSYDRETFIKLSEFGKKFTTKYCDKHPKEHYDSSDYEALYYLKKPVELSSCGVGGSGNWDEHNFFFDRIIGIFEEER